MGAASSRQARSGAVASAERASLTCADMPKQALRIPACPVRDEEAAGSCKGLQRLISVGVPYEMFTTRKRQVPTGRGSTYRSRIIRLVPNDPVLPSLTVLADQVASERETMNAHAESLDGKAGVVLGFAGVLVGLGATALPAVSGRLIFQIGLGVAVVAALLAAWAFLPRRYPVLEVGQLRNNLTAAEEETTLELLDTQIDMVREAAELAKRKGRRVQGSVACLAVATALIVAGTLIATGGSHHA
jgi:hypothetical protein